MTSSDPSVIHHYNEDHHGLKSASAIADFIVKTLNIKPDSVIDIGCGLGQWLHTFSSLCNCEVVGIDGPHVPQELSYISEANRIRIDLVDFIHSPSPSRYDLVVCLEVAEHLDACYAESLISKLISLGDIILFSAAIPGQTGENHVNEQTHNYWIDMFKREDMLVLDPFRKVFWDDIRVNWWYAQNMYLICKPSLCEALHDEYVLDPRMYVHPRLLEMYAPSSVPFKGSNRASFREIVKKLLEKILK